MLELNCSWSIGFLDERNLTSRVFLILSSLKYVSVARSIAAFAVCRFLINANGATVIVRNNATIIESRFRLLLRGLKYLLNLRFIIRWFVSLLSVYFFVRSKLHARKNIEGSGFEKPYREHRLS